MKRLLGLLLVVGMVGCGEVKTVDISKTVERGGLRYEIYSETPFTGVVVAKYENGQKASEGIYKDGKLDGLMTTWHENGQKRSEATFKDGKEVPGTSWDEEGNEIKLMRTQNAPPAAGAGP